MSSIKEDFQKKEVKKSVSQKIAEEIATLIGKRILHPGEHLVENNLVEKFQASRSSVREALSMLERDKLVERIPYQGVKVRNFSSKEIHDLYDTIYGLELLAMEKAISKVTTHDIMELNIILEKQKVTLEEKQVELYYELNEEFHQKLFLITENTFLLDLYNYLYRIVRPFRLLTFAQGDNMLSSYEEHVKQIEALKNKNLSKGSTAINDQKNRALKSLQLLFPKED